MWSVIVRQTVSPEDLGIVVSNIGSTPGFSSIYTSNSAPHTAFVQVSLSRTTRSQLRVHDAGAPAD